MLSACSRAFNVFCRQTVTFRRHPLDLGRERLTVRAGREFDDSTLLGSSPQGPPRWVVTGNCLIAPMLPLLDSPMRLAGHPKRNLPALEEEAQKLNLLFNLVHE